MTKKTLVTSLSLAAAALSLATVPGTSVSAHDFGDYDFNTLLDTPISEIEKVANNQAKEEDEVAVTPDSEVELPAEATPNLFGDHDLDVLLDAPVSEIEKEATVQAMEEDDVDAGEVNPEDIKFPEMFGEFNLDELMDTPMSVIEKEATAQAVEEDDVELKAEDVLVSDKPVVEANPNIFGGRDLDALLDAPMSEVEKEATDQAMEEDDVVLKPEDFLHIETTSKNPPIVVLPTYPLTAALSADSAKENNVSTSSNAVPTVKQDKPVLSQDKLVATDTIPVTTQTTEVIADTNHSDKKELPRTGDATWASMMTALVGMGLVAEAGTLRKRQSN